jgi:RNA polymerase sigma factor (sigma-70 family)
LTAKVAEVPTTIPAADEEIARDQDLLKAIMRLQPRDQAVVTLHYFLDLPLEEVADVTRQSVAAVRSQLYRALHKMRPGLEIPEALR